MEYESPVEMLIFMGDKRVQVLETEKRNLPSPKKKESSLVLGSSSVFCLCCLVKDANQRKKTVDGTFRTPHQGLKKDGL